MGGLRYVFAVVLVGLILLAGYFLYVKPNGNLQNQDLVDHYETAQAQVVTDLRLGICELDTMNPVLSHNKNVQFYSKLVFEPLLDVNQDFSLSNCLASECSKTGDKSYIIKLRQDVKWQDGQAFSARDVQFTINKLKEGINSIYANNVTAISGIEIIDDYTIKLNLYETTPFFEYNLIFPIMPAHYYSEVDFTNFEVIPIGTGMYKIAEQNSDYIKLAKNTFWWNTNKTPKVETITINTYVNTGEIFNAFKIGNVDLVVTENVNFADYIGTIGFQHKIFKGREYDFIAINTTHNVLSEKEVRQAINYGIDKNNIVASIFNNRYFVANGNLDFGSWLYRDSSKMSEYNIEYAQQCLIDNGWNITSRQWQKVENYKTLRTNFNLVVNASNAERVQVAENIKVQLANIGVVINLKKVNDWQYNEYLKNKNYDLILTGTNISINPSLQTYFGANNLTNYSNEDVMKLLNETINITDKSLLKEKFATIQETTNEQFVYIPLYINKNVVLYSTDLIGDVSPNWYNIFYNIENWYRQN